MRKLIVPEKLNEGDKIAFISLSGGRAGDPDMLPRYQRAKKRFEDVFNVQVVETPNALKGRDYIFVHPEKRAEDLMQALEDKSIKGIVCNMGGDDSYRVLPYIDTRVIRDNPKVFMGYSDIATWISVFAYAGVRAYYGPNVLTPIGQPGSLDRYTEDAIKRTLFSSAKIGEIKPCDRHTPIDWGDTPADKIKWTKNTGYKVLQGKGAVEGHLVPVCGGPLWQIMGTKFFPGKDIWEDSIIAIEHSKQMLYGNIHAAKHQLRAFAAAGAFDKAKAILTGPLDKESEDVLLGVINDEVRRPDLVVLENVDFIHRTPMTVLPMCARSRIDCSNAIFEILESGVSDGLEPDKLADELIRQVDRLHTTELGAERIRKNLGLGDVDVVAWCRELILSSFARISREGKNWYVSGHGCVITVNAKSLTIITAHKG